MNIIFATGNKNKIAEANDLLGELGHTVQGLIIDGKKPNFIEPQSDNLLEVALSKISQARSMIKNTDLEGSAILVEDSGLFIDSINNFPGVFSSFIHDSIGVSGILKLLKGSINRDAEYRAVTILDLQGNRWTTNGICRGKIAELEIGENGFGFDPIFIPSQGDGRTFSQMSQKEKSTLSHRSNSLRGLLESLKHPSK